MRQCVQTFDQHQDKAWAMAVSEDEKRVVTGGEDAALVLWRDVTQEEKDKAVEEAARCVIRNITPFFKYSIYYQNLRTRNLFYYVDECIIIADVAYSHYYISRISYDYGRIEFLFYYNLFALKGYIMISFINHTLVTNQYVA